MAFVCQNKRNVYVKTADKLGLFYNRHRLIVEYVLLLLLFVSESNMFTEYLQAGCTVCIGYLVRNVTFKKGTLKKYPSSTKRQRLCIRYM